jgi:hypothetical protein
MRKVIPLSAVDIVVSDGAMRSLSLLRQTPTIQIKSAKMDMLRFLVSDQGLHALLTLGGGRSRIGDDAKSRSPRRPYSELRKSPLLRERFETGRELERAHSDSALSRRKVSSEVATMLPSSGCVIHDGQLQEEMK